MSETPTFCPVCTVSNYKNIESPSSKTETRFASRKDYKPQSTQEVFKNVALSSRKSPTYTMKDKQDEIIRGKFYSKELLLDQSHLSMESFSIELFSNASAQLFPEKTLSSFTNFLREQLDLEDQLEFAFSDISYPSVY